jgi:hypothetical protein
MRDLFNQVTPKRCISPQSVADNTALVGEIIDRKDFESLTYLILTGSLGDAGAEFTALLEEGDVANLSDAAAVSDNDLIGTEALASFIQSDDNKCYKLGYKGSKRYTRLTITPTNNATAALIAATALLGHPSNAPTVNPPA